MCFTDYLAVVVTAKQLEDGRSMLRRKSSFQLEPCNLSYKWRLFVRAKIFKVSERRAGGEFGLPSDEDSQRIQTVDSVYDPNRYSSEKNEPALS